MKDIFTKLYKESYWGKGKFCSGSGRNPKDIKKIALSLALLFDKYNWKTLADIGCGNYTWMKIVLPFLKVESYIGIDIVEELINDNKNNYKDVAFEIRDIITDKLPLANVAIVKDVLPHLSYFYIEKAIENICNTGYEYIILTNYFNDVNKNTRVGGWRMINLEKSPFNLPKPLEIIRQNKDKGLFLYSNNVLRGLSLNLRKRFDKI